MRLSTYGELQWCDRVDAKTYTLTISQTQLTTHTDGKASKAAEAKCTMFRIHKTFS